MLFRLPSEEELTDNKLNEFIAKHDAECAFRFKRLKDAYETDYQIFHQKPKPNYKPDNRIAVNFAKYTVDTFNGFFIGNPIKISVDDDATDNIKKYVEFLDQYNDQDDNNAELSKICCIYGKGYEMYYVDELGNIGITYLTPFDAFMIYDDSVLCRERYFVRLYMRSAGWGAWQSDGLMVGSTNQNRRIEALHIQPVGETDVVVHMKGIGNKEYKNIAKDTLIGTTGQNRRLEAIRVTGKESFYLYRVHQKSIGWSEWANNGEWAGTTGKGLQMEALEIKKSMFSVEPHVQSKGWLSPKAAENVIGITGHALRLEAIRINPYGKTIKAKAHIQSKGWVDYGMITKDTIIGTVGEKKRIECLCFEGDFEYRVHIQGSGWTDWTRADGVATLGTVGQELRIEAIQFR